LLLIGIVVSNAILLVDFAIKARDDHETADEAVMAAGRARLRPILMTALATIFALLPLALGLAGGGNGLISSSLAITVIGGLATLHVPDAARGPGRLLGPRKRPQPPQEEGVRSIASKAGRQE
jgi:multidrug efflux pump subunit AcrB